MSEKKISLATRKRLEATKAKKEAAEAPKKPKENKEKKSIFEHKKNPNFFVKDKKPVEVPVKILVNKEDQKVEKEVKLGQVKRSSPAKKAHNFYYQEEELDQMEDTPDFQVQRTSGPKDIKKTDHSLEERSLPVRQSKHKFATYDLENDEDEEDNENQNFDNQEAEEVEEDEEREQIKANRPSDTKQRKHNFNEEFHNYTDDLNEFHDSSSHQKVEETPETDSHIVEYTSQEPSSEVKMPFKKEYKRWDQAE